MARLWGPALRGLRRRSTRLPAGPYLAVHRLAGAERLAVLLVAACALSLGIFVYAQTVVHSLERSVVAKSALFVGSNVNGTINNDQEPPEGFPFPITKVTRVVRGRRGDRERHADRPDGGRPGDAVGRGLLGSELV